MPDTKSKGDLTEAMIVAHLLQNGDVVLTPFGDSQRFDLVIYRKEKFIRVQCKTGSVKNGAVIFRTASVHKVKGTHSYTLQGYHGQIDLFMVYCPSINKFYSVPIEVASSGMCYLRLEAPSHKRKVGIRWAKDFEF